VRVMSPGGTLTEPPAPVAPELPEAPAEPDEPVAPLVPAPPRPPSVRPETPPVPLTNPPLPVCALWPPAPSALDPSAEEHAAKEDERTMNVAISARVDRTRQLRCPLRHEGFVMMDPSTG
jgi:hypothetical protein